MARNNLILLLLASALWWSGTAQAAEPNFSSTRAEINRYVRGLTNEPSTTFLTDSTLDRMIFYSHRTTMLALGGMTDIDTTTIITARGQHRYPFSSGATTEMRGEVTAVFRRTETNQGVGLTALTKITPDQVGELGEGVIPASYYIDGEFLVLGTKPLGSDTILVHYKPLAADLTLLTTALTVSGEDFEAIAFLTAWKVCMFDGQFTLGQQFFQAWQAMIALKKVQAPQ